MCLCVRERERASERERESMCKCVCACVPRGCELWRGLGVHVFALPLPIRFNVVYLGSYRSTPDRLVKGWLPPACFIASLSDAPHLLTFPVAPPVVRIRLSTQNQRCRWGGTCFLSSNVHVHACIRSLTPSRVHDFCKSFPSRFLRHAEILLLTNSASSFHRCSICHVLV